MTLREIRQELEREFEAKYGHHEAQAMSYALLEDVKGYRPIDVAINGHRELLPETVERIRKIAAKVTHGLPLQYAIGKAHFHGRTFEVTPDVLIPRPETSQLVDIIVDRWRGKRDIDAFDVGTGSGCIGISLALDLPFARVTAIDISTKALEVAKANAQALRCTLDCQLADALKLKQSAIAGDKFDIIVSNPPYIMEREKSAMEANVLDYEPALALFVPDDDPLIYYKAIAEYAIDALNPRGTLYFEINPLCADAMKCMLSRQGFRDVNILKDYKGKNRFAICEK